MRLKQIDHCSLVVSHIDRAIDFYTNVLGLPEVQTPLSFQQHGLPVRWFKLGATYLHLLPKGSAQPVGEHHVAIVVEDAREARAHFARHGVEVREALPITGADRFFISDPDGNVLEIIQWFEPFPATPVGMPRG